MVGSRPYSIMKKQLNHKTKLFLINGVGRRTRTDDNQNHNLALYQLNYTHHIINSRWTAIVNCGTLRTILLRLLLWNYFCAVGFWTTSRLNLFGIGFRFNWRSVFCLRIFHLDISLNNSTVHNLSLGYRTITRLKKGRIVCYSSTGVSRGIRTPGPRLRRAMLYPAELLTHSGAGDENRTHVTSLEG